MTELRDFLTWILNRHHDLGAVTEIRALRREADGRQAVWSGLFGPEHASRLAVDLLPKGRTPRDRIPPGDHPFTGEANLYFSMQGIDLTRIEGAYGRLVRAPRTARDADVAVYTLFAVDLDPVRPSGMSATEDEKTAALEVALQITSWLGERGVRPIQADSGNGLHLLVPVTPRFGADVALASLDAHALLQLLDERFSTPRVKVDTAIFNPSRILKLYGTLAMKGESSEDRPHRISSVDLGDVPPDVDLFTVLGEELAAFREARARGSVSVGPNGHRRPVRPRSVSGESDRVWQVWRHDALAALPLVEVYGTLLTGRPSGAGWLECRDPDSPTGDQHPSAGVADGTGDAERGTYHSFRTGESLSVFDFLYSQGVASDFADARALVAQLSGVALPRVRSHGSPIVPPRTQASQTGGCEAAEPSAADISHTTPLGPSDIPQISPLGPGDDRHVVDFVTNRDSVAELFDRLLKVLIPLGRLFDGEGGLVWVEPGRGPSPVTERQLPGLLSAWLDVRFLRTVGEELRLQRIGVLPFELARTFVVDPRVRAAVPRLGLYTRAPLYTTDWALIARRGYHPVDGGVWYDGVEVTPSPSGTARLRELLDAFNWHTHHDQVNALGVMLTSLTLPLWGRGHPFVVLTANKPGAGKTTLARILGVLAEGREPATVTWTSDDAELEKQLATRVEVGDRFIVLDNVRTRGALASAVLERSITDGRPSFRRLGTNDAITRGRNDLLFCVTMNDARLGPDLRRRALPINLVLETDARAMRYPIEDVVGWALDHRADLLAELAGMVQRWLDSGRPLPEDPARHSTSQAWAGTIDAILRCSGLDGFLANLDSAERAFDPELDLLTDIVALYGDAPPVFASEWAARLEDAGFDDLFKDRLGREKSLRGKATAIGRLFASRLGEVVRSEEKGGRSYRLIRAWPRGEGWKAVYGFEEVG